MPRARTFDPDQTLTLAMRAFWKKGFAETSYGDLVAATQVSRKGLYTVFGDKEVLFVKSLDHYRKTMVPVLFRALYAGDVSLDALIAMFEEFTETAASGRGTLGCLMANTAADITINYPEVRQLVIGHLRDLAQQFSTVFEQAGSDPSEAQRLGRYCCGILQSLLLMAHARADRVLIEEFMTTAIEPLRRLSK